MFLREQSLFTIAGWKHHRTPPDLKYNLPLCPVFYNMPSTHLKSDTRFIVDKIVRTKMNLLPALNGDIQPWPLVNNDYSLTM